MCECIEGTHTHTRAAVLDGVSARCITPSATGCGDGRRGARRKEPSVHVCAPVCHGRPTPGALSPRCRLSGLALPPPQGRSPHSGTNGKAEIVKRAASGAVKAAKPPERSRPPAGGFSAALLSSFGFSASSKRPFNHRRGGKRRDSSRRRKPPRSRAAEDVFLFFLAVNLNKNKV